MPYYVTPEGPELFYRAWGQGPVALFIHPIMSDGTIWLSQLEGLKDIRTCVAIDLRGHGLSDPNPKAMVPIGDYVHDLARFIDAKCPDGPIDVVGLSVGGTLGAHLYEQRPQRLRSLTMISSGFGTGEVKPEIRRYTAELGRMAAIENKGVVLRRWYEYTVGPTSTLHAQARYRSMVERTPTETMVAYLQNGIGDTRPELAATLKLPVFVPIGGEDGVVSLDGAMKTIPDLRTARLEHSGRLAPLETPDELNAAIRKFWSSI